MCGCSLSARVVAWSPQGISAQLPLGAKPRRRGRARRPDHARLVRGARQPLPKEHTAPKRRDNKSPKVCPQIVRFSLNFAKFEELEYTRFRRV